MKEQYEVKRLDRPVDWTVDVPGSKSMTNRALLMAALSDGEVKLEGVLFSDDSRHFLESLVSLGFMVDINESEKAVTVLGCGGNIPKKQAVINVGSAGTAARFLTAMLGFSDGEYTIAASEQMKKRPMQELFSLLTGVGAKITYLETEGHLPVKICGRRNPKADTDQTKADGTPLQLSLDISKSTQFLSALLMVFPIAFDDVTIKMTGTREARSYVEMTEQMMKQFGHKGVEKLENDSYRVRGGDYIARDYDIEPDVSAACYFYALAAATGKRAMVKRMRKESLQGDMKFISLLEKMGCTVSWERDGRQNLWLKGPDGKLKGMEVKMSDFSDQALTLAAIAPFADSEVTIKGIAHIRGQESDRIKVIVDELAKMGILCNELPDGVKIHPGTPKNTNIETYNDHRVAMSFAVTGLAGDGMTILNPMCCKKTFAGFFDEIDRLEE